MFISIEGLDGSGKTTQASLLAEWLRGEGYDVLSTREPGGTVIGEQVRALIHDLKSGPQHPEAKEKKRRELIRQVKELEEGGGYPGLTLRMEGIRAEMFKVADSSMRPEAEVLLFNVSRVQLVAEKIVPHLEKGGIVLCDRFADSTLAYQGFGHQLAKKELKSVVKFSTGGLKPDYTIFLDVDPWEAQRRRFKATLFGEELDHLDMMEMEFHERVYQGYQELMREEPTRWHLVDGRAGISEIHGHLRNFLASVLSHWKPLLNG